MLSAVRTELLTIRIEHGARVDPGELIEAHDLANALRKIQPEAILERLTVETDTGHPFTRLHVEYIADRAAEEARIIERYRNHDPLDYLAPLHSKI